MPEDVLPKATPSESEVCPKEMPLDKNADDGPSKMDIVITHLTESVPMMVDDP